MEIRAFKGWRFAAEGGEVSNLLAPPYDVLTAEDKQALLDRCGNNIVAVDLPHVPPKEAGPDEEYQQAADTLAQWRNDGTLAQDESPALYVYEQTFRWAGATHSRHGLICALRGTELGKDVIPHEHTFAGPKADRLKLMQHTSLQLSSILGFCEDPAGGLSEAMAAACQTPPAAHGVLNDVEEKLWLITDEEQIAEISQLVRDVPAFIADGHHRYTTALNYRDELAAAKGGLPEDHPANFVMFVLIPRSDAGLLVLPTHRIVNGLSADFSIDKLVESTTDFSWKRCSLDDADLTDAGAFLSHHGRGAMGFIGKDPAELWIATLTNPQAMAEAAPDELPVWRELDVSILHKLIIDKALQPWRTDETSVDYSPDGRVVMAACQSGRAQLGICIQSTPVEAVEEIGLAGASMPHKSTYFYPKLATGMVLKPL